MNPRDVLDQLAPLLDEKPIDLGAVFASADAALAEHGFQPGLPDVVLVSDAVMAALKDAQRR